MTNQLLLRCLAFALSVSSSMPAYAQAISAPGPVTAAGLRAVMKSVAETQSPPRSPAARQRRSRSLACGSKIALGFGIGAGVGLTYGALANVDEPVEFTAATTALFTLVGVAIGYKLC